VGIDEPSLKGFGQWPWKRSVHGDFIQLLGVSGARVVSWDFLFTEPAKLEKDTLKEADAITTGVVAALNSAGGKAAELTTDPSLTGIIKKATANSILEIAGDPAFAEAIKNAGATEPKTTVVLGASFGEKAKSPDEADIGITPGSPEAKATKVRPLPKVEGDRSLVLTSQMMLLPAGQLAQEAEIGFVSTPAGSDGIRRWVPLVVRVGEEIYPTLSMQSLLQYWDVKIEDVVVRLGDAVLVGTKEGVKRIPIDDHGRFLVNYRYLARGLQSYDYFQLFDRLISIFVEKKENVGKPLIDGRIVLVGVLADGLSDIGPSPLSELTPLVMVHANIIENVLSQDYAKQAPAAPVWLGAFALGLAGLMVFSKRKLRDHALYSLGLPVAYAGAAYFSWAQWSLWLPLVGPVLGFMSLQVFEVGRRVLAEQKAKQEIKGMFGTYVSPALVTKMIDSGTPPQLGGHDDEITAYFSDIQSFSTFSEKLGSGPLVELMNEYLTACTDIVQGEGGAVDKYIGDAVVAMFGAPLPLPDHAYRACVTTQLVHRKLGELRTKWKSEGDKWPQIVWNMQTRIGLNSGVCMIGNMGSRTRFNYTMMGDNVNLAARMESGAKSWGAYTMVAEATKLACEKHGGDRVVFRLLGRIVVKGRSTAVPIYEIVGLKEHVTQQTRECLGLFEQGLAKHFARDWDGAISLFKQSSLLEPNIPGQTPGVVSNPSLVYIGITEHYKEEPPPDPWDGVYHMKEK
jgi:adenylate cyclase